MKLRPLGGVLHGILSFHHTQLVKEAVLRVFDPFEKSLRAVCLYEFIRVFARPQVNDPALKSGFFQNTDTSDRSPDSCVIAVIGQKHLFGVSFEQRSLPLCERSSQGCNRFVKTRLVHGNDIHIPFA